MLLTYPSIFVSKVDSGNRDFELNNWTKTHESLKSHVFQNNFCVEFLGNSKKSPKKEFESNVGWDFVGSRGWPKGHKNCWDMDRKVWGLCIDVRSSTIWGEVSFVVIWGAISFGESPFCMKLAYMLIQKKVCNAIDSNQGSRLGPRSCELGEASWIQPSPVESG